MKLIIIFAALAIERFLAVGPKIRCFRCLEPYVSVSKKWMQKLPIWCGFGAVVCLVPLIILAGLVEWFLGFFWYGSLSVLFSLAVLVYCLGPKDMYQSLKQLKESPSEEKQKEAVSSLLDTVPSDANAWPRSVVNHVLTSSNRRVFAVLLWYVLCGAAGALFYRLVSQLGPLATNTDEEDNFYKAAPCVAHALDWIPARITAFFYALLGHFSKCFPIWRKQVLSGLDQNDQLLSDCGLQSLDLSNDVSDPLDQKAISESLTLVDRTLIVYLVVVVVLVLSLGMV